MRNFKNRESGYVLIGVITTILLLFVLSFSMITVSVVSFKTSISERNNQSAFYIAEAGLNYKEQRIKQRLSEIYERDEVETEEDFERVVLNDQELSGEFLYNRFEQSNTYAKILVEQKNAYEYDITSTGYIDEESRTLSETIYVEWEDKYEFVEDTTGALPPFAVFTKGKISLGGGHIKGDIGTTSLEENAISFNAGDPTHDGEIYVPEGKQEIVNKNINVKPLADFWKIPTLPPFPVFPDLPKAADISISGSQNQVYKLDESTTSFGEVKLRSNLTLTFDVGDTDKEIVINRLDLSTGHIKIKGRGNLTIYVRDTFVFTGDSSINYQGDPTQLNMYLKKPKSLELGGNQKLHGSIYGQKTDMYIGGSASFIGNIFTGGDTFEIRGGSVDNVSQIVFAPRATAKITGGGKFLGTILSKKFQSSGGIEAKFQPHEDLYEGPISPKALGLTFGDDHPGSNNEIKIPIQGNLTINKSKIVEKNNE